MPANLGWLVVCFVPSLASCIALHLLLLFSSWSSSSPQASLLLFLVVLQLQIRLFVFPGWDQVSVNSKHKILSVRCINLEQTITSNKTLTYTLDSTARTDNAWWVLQPCAIFSSCDKCVIIHDYLGPSFSLCCFLCLFLLHLLLLFVHLLFLIVGY